MYVYFPSLIGHLASVDVKQHESKRILNPFTALKLDRLGQ